MNLKIIVDREFFKLLQIKFVLLFSSLDKLIQLERQQHKLLDFKVLFPPEYFPVVGKPLKVSLIQLNQSCQPKQKPQPEYILKETQKQRKVYFTFESLNIWFCIHRLKGGVYTQAKGRSVAVLESIQRYELCAKRRVVEYFLAIICSHGLLTKCLPNS